MFENLGDISNLLKGFEESAKKVQEELDNKRFSAKSGGGMVEVTVNGNSEVINIDIDDSLLEDKESLVILLIGALNDALKMAEDNKKTAALSALGGLNPFGNN